MMQYHNLKKFLHITSCKVAMLVLVVTGNYSSVSIVTGYRTDNQKTGVQFPAWAVIFFFSTAFRQALGLPCLLSRRYGEGGVLFPQRYRSKFTN
jgi:hypothetical protein